MKNFFLLAISLFLYLNGFNQITGSWQGVLIQKNTDGTTSNYAVWFDIKTDGDKISGTYRSEQANTPYFKISEVIGKIDGNKISIKEQSIGKHLTGKDMIWCIILVKMKYNANKEQLNGFYTSETPNCSSGEIVLLKANKNFNASETEVVRNSTLDDIVYSLIDEEAVTGRQFILEDVRFQSAKYSITSNSYTYLNKLVKILKENKTIKIHLKGHTDSDGRDDANFILSQKRAKSVAHYFIKQGIKKDRISYEGYGESRPIRFGNASKDKQKNRRVELLIISQ